ncbi:hypothetical protein F5Y19DRAFT_476478 [Xylariaceae sp. FL1651]|nr:hypothetical protein F5Y19DRAFT_476478 [Xylariaceae sp. FL1651]
MLTFFISALLVWNLVLTFFVLRDWRLLLKILRWSISIWLICFGILVSEVLREGLIVNGEISLHWDVRLAWTSWFVLVACSVIDWRFLIPAAALPLWFLSYPEVQTLLNYGLVRLKWLCIVHSPLTWAASRPKTLELGIRGYMVAHKLLGKIILPVLRPMKSLMDYAAGWVLWTTDHSLEKLRPPPRWTWLPFTGRW